jgi:hypothetical protein
VWPSDKKYDAQPGRPSGVSRKLVPVCAAPAMKIIGSGAVAGAGFGESFSTYICPVMAMGVKLVALSYLRCQMPRYHIPERDRILVPRHLCTAHQRRERRVLGRCLRVGNCWLAH